MVKSKRLSALFLSAAMMFSAAVAAPAAQAMAAAGDPLTLKTNVLHVSADSTKVYVIISAENLTSLDGLSFNVTYDPQKLSIPVPEMGEFGVTSQANDAKWTAYTNYCNAAKLTAINSFDHLLLHDAKHVSGELSSKVGVVGAGTTPVTASGDLLKLVFDVKPGTLTAGQSLPFSITEAEFTDGSGGTIASVVQQATGGTISAKNIGDIDPDPGIGSGDVTYLKRHLAGRTGFEYSTAMDVDRNGTVDSGDVTYLKRFLAGRTGFTLEP